MSDDSEGTRRRQRSPEHPSVNLEEALARAHELFEAEGLVQVPVKVAVQDWGYSPKSSTGIRLVAALRHYGLLEEEGSGDSRKVSLSQLAKKIILDKRNRSEDRKQAVRSAALHPTVFRELYEEFGGELPSQQTLEYHLPTEMGFNPKKVGKVVDNYIDTIKYADLDGRAFGIDIEDDESGDTDEQGNGRAEDHEDPEQEGRGEMPVVSPKESEKPWDWTIPLLGGKQAVLRVPRPLSEEDFEHLEDMLKDFFPKQRRMLVSEEKAEGGGSETGADD